MSGDTGDAVDLPRLYTELASWWPLLSPPDEYTEEAAFYFQTMFEACGERLDTMLELGSGGGSNAYHLKLRCQLTLCDLSAEMLDISKRLNPECEHLRGDMRSLRLSREFDAVFAHDAISYMQTPADLRAVLTTAAAHCRVGGAVLCAPDYVEETFWPITHSGGTDVAERGVRYLEWIWDPVPNDQSYRADFVYLLRQEDEMEVRDDHHVFGLFPRDTWLDLYREVGLDGRVVVMDGHDEPHGSPVFVGVKRG